MKILIIGFHRSGTTLLRRMVQCHPRVRKIWHEVFFLAHVNSSDELNSNISIQDPVNQTWGEKVPYVRRVRGKMTPVAYSEKWLRFYPTDGRVIHIIRHPLDTGLSAVRKKKVGNQNLIRQLHNYRGSVIPLVSFTMKNKNSMNVKYEELILEPIKIMNMIFSFCGLPPTNVIKRMSSIKKEKYKRVDPSRVFAYKNETFGNLPDISEHFKLLNRIPGPPYIWI